MTRKKPEAAATWEPIDSVTPWAKNPNKHPEEQLDKLQKLIEQTAWGAIVVAQQSSRRIIAGHGRQVVARRMGMERIPVRFVDVTDEQAALMALADNQLPTLAETDEELLAEVLRDLDVAEVDLSNLGWSDDELAELLKGDDPPEPTDEAPEVQPGPADSVLGRVYELGVHRLVCGDSTKAEAWAFLGEERLQMVWTDPPYGVDMEAVNEALAQTGRRSTTRSTHGLSNDTLTPEQLLAFLSAAFATLRAACQPGAAWYVAAPANGSLFFAFGSALGDIWRHTPIWLKDAFVLGRSDYHYRHEPIFYGWVPGAAHYFIDDRTQDSVLEFPRPRASAEHPTMKPVALVQRCIENSSKPGWLVGDPFAGSGTTLLACAATGRVARCIEIDPHYCDVVRRRWTRYAKEAGIDPGEGALDG